MGNCLSMIFWHDIIKSCKKNYYNIKNKKTHNANFNYTDVCVQTDNTHNELNKPLLKDTSSINNLNHSMYNSTYSNNNENSSSELFTSALSNLDNL